MNLVVLREIGLTESEIKIYEALTDLGIATINKIHRVANVERRYIYDLLDKLIRKGLVSYNIEKGKKTFQITHPNKILSYVDEQENALEKTRKKLEKEIPEIINKFNENKQEIRAEIYRGKEGFKAIGEDMLNYKDNYFIGGTGAVHEFMPNTWKFYNKRRIENKVMWHDLIIEGTLMNNFKNKSETGLKKIHYYEFRILPKELASPNIICIYGDKVANMLWKNDLFAYVVEDKETAKSYLEYFKFLWKVCK